MDCKDKELKRLIQILLENIEADSPIIILLGKIDNIEKYLRKKGGLSENL